MTRSRKPGVNEGGRRVGQYHQNAVLTDSEVDRIREMYEEGLWSYAQLARLFEVGKTTIADIIKYRRRGHRIKVDGS